MKDNKQRVVLETEEGCCKDEKMLREVWELRLKEVASHYKIKSVKVMKKPNPKIYKKEKCVRCGKPCTRILCWNCYTSKKGRYKGRVSTLRLAGNKK